MRKRIFIVLLGLLALHLKSQVNFSVAAFQRLDPSVCWNVKVQINSAGERIVLFGKVTDDNGNVLLECETEKVTLHSGLSQLNESMVRTASVKFYDDDVRKYLARYGHLPAGRYQFCTAAKIANSEEELGDDCITLTQVNTDTIERKKKVKLPEGIQLYGNAGIEHIYSNRQGTDQVMPPHLLRIWAQPGMSIYTLPFYLNLYYTTERTYARPNQFAASFNFDAQRFKDNLRSMVEQKILERTKLNLANLSRMHEQVAELGNINEKLKGLSADNGEISSLSSKIKAADYDGITESIGALNNLAAEALKKIDYDSLKSSYINTKNSLAEYVPKDSTEEVQKKVLSDTIDARLQRLEAKKDSTLSKLRGYGDKIKELSNKKAEVEKWMQQLAGLKAAAGQLQQLTEKKNYLEGLQQKLENTSMSSFGDLSRLNDPVILKQNLIEQGMFTGVNKLFFGVKQLSVGTVYPYYSPLILNGIQVQGGVVEVNPGLFYINVTGGNTHIGTTNLLDVFNSAYQRWMLGGRIGVGKPERSHFFLSYIHSFDKNNSLPGDITSTIRPAQNDVLSATLQLTFWKGKIRLLGEAAGSGFNRNRNDSALKVQNTYYEKIPAFLKPNLSTSYDYAYTAKADLNLWKGSLLNAYTEYIGPGYSSFGVPFLRNDVLRYGGRIDQALWKNRIKLSGKYKYEIDNLIDTKRATSTTHFFGGGISFNQKKLPTLKVDYNGNMRNNVYTSQLMHSLNFNSSYNYKVAKTSLRTVLNYQFVMSNADSVSFADYQLHNVLLTQTVSFKAPVTVLATVGFNQLKSILETNRQVQFGAGLISTPLKNFTTAVNIDGAKNFGKDYRLGATLDLSYFFLNHITLSTNLRFNRYQNFYITQIPYNEVVLTSRLLVTW